MKGLTLIVLVFASTSLLADELLIFKRLSDDIGSRDFPIRHTVWHVDALTYGTAPLLKEANALANATGVIEGQQYLEAQFHQSEPSLWVALWAITFAAREKMALYGLQQVPSAVWLDDDGGIISRYPSFNHVDQIDFETALTTNNTPNSAPNKTPNSTPTKTPNSGGLQ